MTVRIRLLLGAALALLVAPFLVQPPAAQAAETQRLVSEVANQSTCLQNYSTGFGVVRCSATDAQRFVISGYDSTDTWYRLMNVATKRCMAAGGGTLHMETCAAKGSSNEFSQSWHFSGIGPASPVDSQVLNRSSHTCLYGSTGGSVRMDPCSRYGQPGWLNHTWFRAY